MECKKSRIGGQRTVISIHRTWKKVILLGVWIRRKSNEWSKLLIGPRREDTNAYNGIGTETRKKNSIRKP